VFFDASHDIASERDEEYANDVSKVGHMFSKLLNSRRVRTAMCASEKLGREPASVEGTELCSPACIEKSFSCGPQVLQHGFNFIW
jgi:hypothetical protein